MYNGRAGRDVWYNIFELHGNSYCCQTHQFTVSLNERFVTGASDKIGICNDNNCSQAGSFVDEQIVWKPNQYSLWRQWSIDGSPIPVWDPKTSSPASYEILHLKFGPHFTMDYGK
jgi:hypothetical protein